MPLTFPVDCDSPRRRTEYCYRAQELLRLVHNGMGRWYREGLTETQWGKFPQRVKNRYPYKPQLTEEDWRDFVSLFGRLNHKVAVKLLESRDQLKESIAWAIDVNEILEE